MHVYTIIHTGRDTGRVGAATTAQRKPQTLATLRCHYSRVKEGRGQCEAGTRGDALAGSRRVARGYDDLWLLPVSETVGDDGSYAGRA